MSSPHHALRPGIAAIAACLAAALACAGNSRPGKAASGDGCLPVEGRLAADVPWDSLPGSWRLTLVATAGPKAGTRVEGTMTLQARDPAVRRMESPGTTAITVPIFGTTDIALEDVGAVRIGNVQSADSAQPGLAIWVSTAADTAVSAVLRIGQEALRTDIVRFDGGYTALFLRQVSATSIRGGWTSAVTPMESSSGHFCAVRQE
jgi:hypothetical protein